MDYLKRLIYNDYDKQETKYIKKEEPNSIDEEN